MFFKIVIKNMKYNIKNYILFFIGNMIGVTTFFVFWGIYSVVKSSASNSINLEDTLVEIIISVLVITIFATALMIYSLMNYIKLKFRDYALFIILGGKEKNNIFYDWFRIFVWMGHIIGKWSTYGKNYFFLCTKNMAQFISNVYFLYKNWLGYLS